MIYEKIVLQALPPPCPSVRSSIRCVCVRARIETTLIYCVLRFEQQPKNVCMHCARKTFRTFTFECERAMYKSRSARVFCYTNAFNKCNQIVIYLCMLLLNTLSIAIMLFSSITRQLKRVVTTRQPQPTNAQKYIKHKNKNATRNKNGRVGSATKVQQKQRE